MSTRSQKRKALNHLPSGQFETSLIENNNIENSVAGPSIYGRHAEKLDEIKTPPRQKIISDLTKILSENQKEC